MSLNLNQDKSHHHQAGDKIKHPSDDESYDDDDDDDDGQDELPLCSKEVEKGEGDASEEGQLYKSRSMILCQ